jgi:hypothetical protein
VQRTRGRIRRDAATCADFKSDAGSRQPVSLAKKNSGFAGEAEEYVDFDTVREFDVFEQVEDAAAEAGADLADIAR